MSINIKDDEQDTISGFMTMTVYSVISDVLHVSLDQISPDSQLTNDLGMTEHSQSVLIQTIQDLFDGLLIDLSTKSLVQDITDQVLQDELEELEFDESEYLEPVF